MTTYMCMCISLTNATACKYDIQINTVTTQSTVITELRLYLAEGLMSRALGDSIRTRRHSTLLEVVDHSRCRKVFAVQSNEQSPGKKHLAVPRAITRKKTHYTTIPRLTMDGLTPKAATAIDNLTLESYSDKLLQTL